MSESPAVVVLVVEDDVLLRFATADDLRDHGYCVIEACTGDEAVSILATRVAVDIVLSDIRMPGSRDGIALARYVKANHPDKRVILVSGERPPADISPDIVEAFFQKPYAAATLMGKIDSVVAGIQRRSNPR